MLKTDEAYFSVKYNICDLWLGSNVGVCVTDVVWDVTAYWLWWTPDKITVLSTVCDAFLFFYNISNHRGEKNANTDYSFMNPNSGGVLLSGSPTEWQMAEWTLYTEVRCEYWINRCPVALQVSLFQTKAHKENCARTGRKEMGNHCHNIISCQIMFHNTAREYRS